ncbi:Cysteine protease ATG4B [Nymphon striatum]|nr:Cysteine protease ATG4B [Nymphon striatum]
MSDLRPQLILELKWPSNVTISLHELKIKITFEKQKTVKNMDEIKENIKSKLWLTYRKNFAPIGGTGPTSDAGWGCMLRCGQMILAQALLTRHLGQAQMGAMEGKEVGQWFGPNTIAQVLNQITPFSIIKSKHFSAEPHKNLSCTDSFCCLVSKYRRHVRVFPNINQSSLVHFCTKKSKKREESPQSSPRAMNASTDSNGFAMAEMKSEDNKDKEPSCSNNEDQYCANASSSSPSKAENSVINSGESNISEDKISEESTWKPLLLFVPLRLGLSEINPVYICSLKNCFKLKQCVGMIGGKPNHALFFVGFVGDELIYLDPHTTQPTTTCFNDECGKHSLKIDETYHCKMASRMKVLNVDPSLAIGFLCESENDFRDFCSHVRKFLIEPEVQPLFELCKERPPHWPLLSPQNSYESGVEEVICDTSDEDFVLLG